MPAQAISLGYERRNIDEFINILVSHKVKKVLDVREAPTSRRKDFRKSALSEYLREFGIDYVHLRLAGNPHRKEKEDIEHCLQLYARYLNKNHNVIELVAAELRGKSVAVLCYEREHKKCHRSVLLAAVCQHSHSIKVITVD